MRIALVILHADPARGGAERYTADLAEALARRGHEVSLLASDFAGAIPGVQPVEIPAGGATRTGRYRRFLRNLDEHLDRVDYGIVHAMLPVRRCDVYHPHAGMAAEQMEKGNRLLNPRRRLMAEVERNLITGDKPPVVIALSEYVKRSIQKYYPLSGNRLVTLFNAVNLDLFVPGRSEEARHWLRERHGWPDGTVGLMIAQDFERKGLSQAIRALAAVDDDVSLVVVGKDDPQAYRWEIENAGGVGVLFAGPTHNPLRYYRESDFFVLPTKHDPCSLVVLEALAMGLPVISTVYNGATEIMTDGVHGYVLPDPNDAGALAGAMRKMLDPDRRAQMSRACLELRPQLSYDTHLDRLFGIYERAMKTRNA